MHAYRTRRAGRFFDLIRYMAESEIKAGNTVSLINEVDASAIESIRKRLGVRRPSYTAFVIKALAMGLRQYPYANRRHYFLPLWPFGGSRLQEFRVCDVAVACEREVPNSESAVFIDIVRDADKKSLPEINASLRQLAACDASNNRQWREFRSLGTRWPRWLARWAVHLPVLFPSLWHRYRGGAALVSSPAKYGVDLMNGSWPATLGVSFGFVKPRAIVMDGNVVARPTFWFLLNFDRRVMAGAQAARFFKYMVDLLEHADERLMAEESPEPDAESCPEYQPEPAPVCA